jgi:MurNAc alpha-1-phosphate uridylyltransferase
MRAMVLAAGRGQRMQPLTDAMPKPLLQVNEQPLLDFHLHALARAGVRDIVINVAWLQQQIREHVGAGATYGLQVHYSDEGDTALETGGGIFRALPWLGDAPFWIVNGDIHVDFDFEPPALQPETLAHLYLTPNPAHNPAGDFSLEGSSVVNTGPAMLTYTGIAVLRPELFAGCVEGVFPLAPLLRGAAAAGNVAGELLPGSWCDVGTPERLAELDRRLRA